MVVLEAEDKLKGPVDDAQVYDLVLRATGSESRAAAALSARLAERLKANETPDI
jgi:hypothetical protein